METTNVSYHPSPGVSSLPLTCPDFGTSFPSQSEPSAVGLLQARPSSLRGTAWSSAAQGSAGQEVGLLFLLQGLQLTVLAASQALSLTPPQSWSLGPGYKCPLNGNRYTLRQQVSPFHLRKFKFRVYVHNHLVMEAECCRPDPLLTHILHLQKLTNPATGEKFLSPT